MSDLMRATIDAIWPDGSIWKVAPDLDLDKMLDGSAANWETIRIFLEELKDVRDPNLTNFLADLEREFGVFPNESLTETQRRDQLNSIVFNRDSNGSVDVMQKALDDAGFSVQVHENNPAVDPELFLNQIFQMVAAGGNAFAGRSDAFAGRVGGELIVNGDIFTTSRLFDVVSGGDVFAGNGATAGEYTGLIRDGIEYEIPTDPGDWPLVFFVGGDATRDGSGALTNIDIATVPLLQRSSFRRLILKLKPAHSWGGLIITYT